MKKLIITFSFTFFISLISNAQVIKDSLPLKWEVGIAPSYIYTYPTYNTTSGNTKVNPMIGYNIVAKYRILKYLRLTFGVSYDKLNYESSVYNSYFGYYHDTFKYFILSLPIQFNLNFKIKKINLSVNPGTNFEILVKNILTSVHPSVYTPFWFDSSKKIFIATNLSVSTEYELSNKIILFAEANFINAITPIYYIYDTYDGRVHHSDYLKYNKISLGIFYSITKRNNK